MERSEVDVVNLPIGFRFQPTDEELVLHYLKRKVLCIPLPVAIIPTFQIFRLNPWDLPGELKEKRYLFTKRSNNLSCRSNDCGYWKRSNKRERQILGKGSNLVIGLRRSYLFYQATGLKTQWVMHQFCLVSDSNSKIMVPVGDWVVCRVFQRRRKSRNRRLGFTLPQATSSSSCSSGITAEISCTLDQDQEATSSGR